MRRSGTRPQRLARWLLAHCSRDGGPLHGDLLEVRDAQRGRTGRVAAAVWFWREVIIACGYGLMDGVTERRWGWRAIRSAGQPIRPLRSLRRRPAFSATAILLMGLAAGSLSALSGIRRALIGVPRALESVRVITGSATERGWKMAYLSVPEIRDLARSVDDLEEVGVFRPDAIVGLRTAGAFRAVNVVFADAMYFEVLGAKAELGRGFTAADGRAETGPFALLSDAIWRDEFASDPVVAGRRIEVAGRAYTVLGVMAEDFHDAGGSAPTDVWLPLGDVPAFFGEGSLTSRTARWVMAVARVGRGEGAQREADRVAGELARLYPEAQRGRGFAFVRLDQWWHGRAEGPLRILVIGELSLLVLVLGNLAVLFRGRSEERAPEMALRVALGARRGALARIVLLEGAILAIAATLLGVGVARALLESGAARLLEGLPQLVEPRLDIPAVATCAGLIAALSLLFGMATPNGGGLHLSGRRVRLLMALQAGLAAASLTVAGALVEDSRTVSHTPTGFEATGLLTARLDLTLATMDRDTALDAIGARVEFARRLVDAAPGIRGVQRAGLVGPSLFGDAHGHMPFNPEGIDPGEDEGGWVAQRITATPGALATLGVAILSGRDLAWSDRDPAAPVAIVDERIARRFWPEGDVVGKRFCRMRPCVPVTIVGVAEVSKNRGRIRPDAGIVGDVYLPYAQAPSTATTVTVRGDGDGADPVADLRQLIAHLAPSAVLSDVRWMDDRLREDERLQRMTAMLAAACAALAAILALTGTYGLVAFQLNRTRRDMVVRLALGARWSVLARLILLEGGIPAAIGAAGGGTVGLVLVPVVTELASPVGGIGGWGWTESSVLSAILLLAAGIASMLPLARLNSIRPMEILREN